MKKTMMFIVIAISAFLSGCATTDNNDDTSFMTTLSETASNIGGSIGDTASSLTDMMDYKEGYFVSDDVISSMKSEKMTSAQVTALIGPPNIKTQVGSKEIWSYPYTKIGAFSGNVNETTSVEFKYGRVSDAYKFTGNHQTGNPLIDASMK